MRLIGRRVDESVGVEGVKYGHSPCQILYQWVEHQIQSAQIQTKTKLNAGPWLMQVKTATCAKTDCGLSDNVAIGKRYWSPTQSHKTQRIFCSILFFMSRKKISDSLEKTPPHARACLVRKHNIRKRNQNQIKPAFASIKSF